MKLYSQRNTPRSEVLRYDVPEQTRSRILAVLEGFCSAQHGGFDGVLNVLGSDLFKRYGYLRRPSFRAASVSDNPVIEHFFCCTDEQALDFIEAFFQQHGYAGGQTGVDAVNEIFREMGLGYEMTAFIEHREEKETSLFGRKRMGTVIAYDYPRMIRRQHQLLHQEVVAPALHLLTDRRLDVANSEMLKAHTAIREGRFAEGITLAISAFESFLKTLCKIKEWPYPEHGNCSDLIRICRDQGLFPPFYSSTFETVGAIRNRLGDAHGRGPEEPPRVGIEHAEHAVYLTSAHILFLTKLAGLQ